jgi:hypothetical protein
MDQSSGKSSNKLKFIVGDMDDTYNTPEVKDYIQKGEEHVNERKLIFC